MNKLKLVGIALGALSASACLETRDTTLQDSIETTPPPSTFKALFDPANGVIPFPSNVLFSGSLDGTLNIPGVDENDFSDPKVAMNALDGFSTMAPITTGFEEAIDPASINGQSVRVFEVSADPFTTVVTGVTTELTFGVDYFPSLSPDKKTLIIFPLKTLKAGAHYAVVITNKLRGESGSVAGSDSVFSLMKSSSTLVDESEKSLVPLLKNEQALSVERLRQLNNATEAHLTAYTAAADSVPVLKKKDIILAWTFKTQSVGTVLQKAFELTPENPDVSVVDVADDSTNYPNVDVWAGALTVPYYLEGGPTNPLGAVTTRWKTPNGDSVTSLNVNLLGIQSRDESIPVLLSIPKTSKPATGWPIVVYQHGITGDRTNALPVMNALAANGIASVAIDIPLHGVTDTSNPYHANNVSGVSATERHFNLDLINNENFSSGPDGVLDETGTHFINVRYLLNSRDNVRQGVADLFALVKAIPNIDIDNDTGSVDFNMEQLSFVGHSLGAMLGTVALKYDTNYKSAVLVSPGGGIAKLLETSTRGALVEGGLLQAGVAKGSAEYEAFFVATQTVLDDSDPLNYAADTTTGQGVYMVEMVGDPVIPNNAWPVPPSGRPDSSPSPVAGTDPLRRAMGLSVVTASQADTGADLAVVTLYKDGHHNLLISESVLDGPDKGLVKDHWLALQAELHAQISSFVSSGGKSLTITDEGALSSGP